MIEFRQKCFTEYDAMRSLYNQLSRDFNWKNRIKVIDKSSLVPILSGNNIVIERFVISKSFFGKDRYRVYLKLGAKVKLPDDVRLPGRDVNERVGGLSMNFNGGIFVNNGDGDKKKDDKKKNEQQKNNSQVVEDSGTIQKEFGAPPVFSTAFRPNNIDLTIEKTIPMAENVKYNKKDRSLVLEFERLDTIKDILDSLPFGINYNLYLLA